MKLAIINWVYASLREERGPADVEVEGHEGTPGYDAREVMDFLIRKSGKSFPYWVYWTQEATGRDNNASLGSVLEVVYEDEPQVITKLMKAGAARFYEEEADDEVPVKIGD